MKKIIVAILLLTSLHTGAQQIAGYWYGTANPDYGTSNNYLIELILNQEQTDCRNKGCRILKRCS